MRTWARNVKRKDKKVFQKNLEKIKYKSDKKRGKTKFKFI